MHMFAATPPVLIPNPVVVEVTRYYEIKGRHEADLVNEMNSKGYRTGKTTYWGNTSTQVRSTFEVKKYQGQACRVVNPKVTIRITTTLPHWDPPAGTSEVVIKKWQKLYAALQHHEGEHGQIAKDEGNAYVALMRGHSSDDSCERLKAYLDDEGNKILQADSVKNAELDRRTRHGVSEGVAISW
jgi:predicted secreted Zn-dependent protease